MRTGDIMIKGYVSADRQQDLICLFGKLEWHLNYHPYKEDGEYEYEVDMDITKHAWMTIMFEGLPCADLLKIYHLITRANMPLRFRGHHNMAKIPGIRIRVNEDMDIELFYQAIRQLFAIAFAEIPKSCLKSTEITIDDQWHDLEAEE